MLEITPVETIWNVTSVFSLVGTTGLVLALTLELLIIIPILVKIGLIEYKSYSIKRKYILFILFLAIAVLTPDPTLYSTVILFFPAMLSIEAGFMIGKFYENKETKGLNTHTHKNLDERNKM
jgi:sec-independent protein translocase protein TatC